LVLLLLLYNIYILNFFIFYERSHEVQDVIRQNIKNNEKAKKLERTSGTFSTYGHLEELNTVFI
jgi:hypothetical protein